MTTFQDLQQGNQFQAGTNQSIRNIVMAPIIEANKENLTIDFNGVQIQLKANWSLSKKTVTYFSSLSVDDYITITGSRFGLKKDTKKYRNKETKR